MRPTIPRSVVLILLVSLWAVTPLAVAEVNHATVKVWDTTILGLTPGESVEDPAGLSGHGTGYPTIATVYARSSHPGGPSGVSYWNPDSNVFVWYGKTLGGVPAMQLPLPPPSSGFPGGVDINRGGGPVLAGGPFGTSFGPGDVWVGGAQNEPLYVLMAGTDPTTGAGRFRSYGTLTGVEPPAGTAFGVEVDEATGTVFVAQPWERRIIRVHPSTAMVTNWNMGDSCGGSCGSPMYVTVDQAGRPYNTTLNSVFGDGIVRVNAGADGVLGINPVTNMSDDTISLWPVPTQPAFRAPPVFLTMPEENPNGLITADSAGNVWFSESEGHKIGRLSAGLDGTVGTPDDQICEFTTAGLLNPQQIAVTGSAGSLQTLFTEGEGNSVSVLTQAEADLATVPNRVCTTVAPFIFPVPVQVVGPTETFDELVPPLQATIVPTIHQVTATGGSGILRFSPMPNPTPIGDPANGFPSGMTGVYATNRIAGAYLKGNKHFEVESTMITAPPP